MDKYIIAIFKGNPDNYDENDSMKLAKIKKFTS